MFWQPKKSCKGKYLVYILFICYYFFKDNINFSFSFTFSSQWVDGTQPKGKAGKQKGKAATTSASAKIG